MCGLKMQIEENGGGLNKIMQQALNLQLMIVLGKSREFFVYK